MMALARTSLVTLGLLFGVLVGCNDASSNDDDVACQPGTAFCECLGGTVCSGSLVCEGGYCVEGADTDVDTDASTDADTETGDTGTMEPGGPEIVDFGTNVSTLTEGENVIFTATVIDPDGPDDLQGGSLKSPDDAITYGAFNDNGDGTFSITVSWAEMHQAQAIEFEGSAMRTFKVVFFDNMGKQASQQTVITFTCAGGCAFEGTCPDTQTDSNHCGACGNVCEVADESGACSSGACTPTWSDCVISMGPLATCADVCQSQGYPGCESDACNWGASVFWFSDQTDCTNFSFPNGRTGTCEVEPDVSLGNYYRCCCLPKN